MKAFELRCLGALTLLSCSLPASLIAQNWVQTSAPDANWYSIACSSDGSNLVAAANPGWIYLSTDSGVTWTTTGFSNAWSSVASSADGSRLAAAGGGAVYVSPDSGNSWSASAGPWTPAPANPVCLATSADGTHLIAGVQMIGVFTSTNAGLNWVSNNVGQLPWLSVASSAVGHRLCAVQDSSLNVLVSTNSGQTWFLPRAPGANWRAVAVSADGEKAVGAATFWGIYATTNAGSTWRKTSAPGLNWQAIASSADGTALAASTGVIGNSSARYGPIYTSTDAGASWNLSSAPTNMWTAICSSADGKRLAAVVHGGGIYTWQATPKPSIVIASAAGNLLLSWIVPSMTFGLQAAPGPVGPWSDVTAAQTLNMSNLQYQVVLPAASGPRFFRLISR